MSKQTRQEEKLDMQIKKLLNNEIDTTNKGVKPIKKQETVRFTKTTKKSPKKTVNMDEKTKVINIKQIQTNKKIKPMEKREKLKKEYLDKKEKVNEILDNETEVDKLIKFLTKLFAVLVSIMVIIFILICIV